MLPADTVGCEVARLFTPPAGSLTPATSRGFEAVTFAEDVLGLELMPWQRWLLLHALELAPDGSYRFRTLLVLCARQNGKTTLMQVLALWRMFVDRAGLVIGTAQNLSMAEETWDGALSMAEGVPDLAAEVEHVSRVNGDKHLRLTTGERYKVTAASRRGGRGLSSDLVLLDELREHQDWQAWSAVTKTTMARPAPMVAGFSNAGDGHSVVLSSLRDRALAAASDPTSTLGIFEWSALDGCPIDDPAAWAQANPALGHRMGVQAIRSALETDPEDVIRCEVLCQWVTVLGTAIPEPVWAALADAAPGPPDRRSAVFALDVAPDHSHGDARRRLATAGRCGAARCGRAPAGRGLGSRVRQAGAGQVPSQPAAGPDRRHRGVPRPELGAGRGDRRERAAPVLRRGVRSPGRRGHRRQGPARKPLPVERGGGGRPVGTER